MTDLDTLLDQNTAPSVSGGLSSRILAAAETVQPANDVISPRRWWAAGGIAAMAVMAALFVIQPTSEPSTDWVQIADGSGFSELYEWVEGDEG
jgi:hypothetical protein